MSTRYRSEIEQATTEKCSFKCVLPDPLPNPPISYPAHDRDCLLPPITWSYQKFWDESWNGDRSTWKNCENYKVVTAKPSEKWKFTMYNGGQSAPYYYTADAKSPFMRYRQYNYFGSYIDPFGEPGRPTVGLTSFDQPNALDGTFVPPPANLDKLNDMALKVMLPSIKEDLSIVNSIIELKDFKRLPGLCRRLREVVPLVARFWKKRKPIHSLRDLLSLPAEVYLTHQFAISPLIGDIRGVYSALTSWQAQISDLINREGKMQTRHFSYKWLEYPDQTDDSPTNGLDQPGWLIDPVITFGLRRQVWNTASEFHAEIQYNYNYTEYQRTHATALALLDRLGINLNGQILWNALPWSFVVDWVLDINQFLGTYAKAQNMEPTINIHQYLWSIKRHRKIQVRSVVKTVHPASDVTNGLQIPLPLTNEYAYRRQVGLPGYSSLTSSGLSSKEVSLGAALVVVRRKYRGPRGLTTPNKPRK